MKKITKTLFLILTVTALCFAVSMLASAETEGFYSYNVENGEAIITYVDESISGDVVIPDTLGGYKVTEIGYAFNFCDNITSVTIPGSVTTISFLAFRSCANLTTIIVDENNMNYSSDEYGVLFDKNKTVLIEYPKNNERTSYIVPDSVISIGDSAFSGSENLTSVTIGNSVTSIGDSAFYICENLESVTMGNSVTSISNSMFDGCVSLECITIPDSVTKIGYDAFKYCESLKSIVIPDSVTSIGNEAFFKCVSLENVVIGDGVASMGSEVFNYCDSIQSITVDENNSYYSADDYGVLFDKNKNILIKYTTGNARESYEIPEGVTSIGYAAFANNSTLKYVAIPESVTSIGNEAFYQCISLENVIIPDSIKSIGWGAFAFCTNFTRVIVPDGIESVDYVSFAAMPFLEEMIIKDMDVVLAETYIGMNEFAITGIGREEFLDLFARYNKGEVSDEEFLKYIVYFDEITYIGTIYCHDGSTAEAYAIENGIDYVLTHFFEGDWTYDYEQMIRWRKCIHCDELEVEQLEITTEDGVEIVEPEDTDTDFDVEKIEGDKFILIEEAVTDNIGEEWDVLKAFDITLKNKDGVHVQPDGTVKVKLPLDWEKDGNYKVYRVNEDGTLTDMNAYRQGSHMVFETDHFSIYVIVEEGVQGEEDDKPATEEKLPSDFLHEIFALLVDLIRLIIDFLCLI